MICSCHGMSLIEETLHIFPFLPKMTQGIYCIVVIFRLPMYGEAKLALFIYLWYPKTKGTAYIYDTILKPFVAKYETDIDRGLMEFRAKAWDLAIYYWQNCTQIGQAKLLQMLEYIASQSKRGTNPNSEVTFFFFDLYYYQLHT